MNKYNEEYYVLKKSREKGVPNLEGTDQTKTRDIRFENFTYPGIPLSYVNSRKESYKEKGILTITPEIMVHNSSLVVIDGIKTAFEIMGVGNIQYYPSIYIDDDGEWHEDYWYVHEGDKLDCWDRDESEVRVIDDDDDDDDDDDFVIPPRVDRYSLSQPILDEIPEVDRLIFRIGGTGLAELFVHQRIIDYFEEAQVTGWRSFKVSEYQYGMEFR